MCIAGSPLQLGPLVPCPPTRSTWTFRQRFSFDSSICSAEYEQDSRAVGEPPQSLILRWTRLTTRKSMSG